MCSCAGEPVTGFVPMRKNIARLILTNLFVVVLISAVLPLLTRLVSPADWGLYQLLVNLAIVVASILFLQLDLTYMVTAARQSRRLIAAVVPPIGLAMALLATGVVAALICVSADYGLGALVAVPAALGLAFYQMQQVIQAAEGEFKGYARTKVMVQVGQYLGLAIVAVVSPQPLLLFLAWSFPLLPLSVTYCKRQWQPRLWRHTARVLRHYSSTTSYGAVSVLINNARNVIPLMLLFAIAEPHDYGIFMLAIRLLDLPVSVAGTALQHVLMPVLGSLWAAQREKAVLLFLRWLALLVAAAVAGGVLLAMIPDSLYTFAFGVEWQGLRQWMLLVAAWKLVEFINVPLAPVSNLLANQKAVAFIRAFYLTVSVVAMMMVETFLAGVLVIVVFSSSYYLTCIALNFCQLLRERKVSCL